MVTDRKRPAPPLLPTADNVPIELRNLVRWVDWRAVWDEVKGKWRKPPHSPKTGEAIGAVVKWIDHFATFDEALAGAVKHGLDGVGFVFVDGDGYVGVDFDNSYEGDEPTPEAASWRRWFPSYAEKSPSGQGFHIICKGQIGRALTAKPLAHGAATAEVYSKDRYFTFTGDRLNGVTAIVDCQAGLDKLMAALGADTSPVDAEPLRPMSKATVRKLHADNLAALRAAREGEGNALLNTAAFFAGKCFSSGALDGTAESLKQELLHIVTMEWSKPHGESGARSTISSGWASGADDPLQLSEDEWPEVTRLLDEFNGRFYVVSDFGGRCRVCWEDPDPNVKGKGVILGNQAFSDFRNRFLNTFVQTGIKTTANGDVQPKGDTKAEVWLKSRHRRQYEKIVFLPNVTTPADVRNLWRGFAFEPRKGDCSLYLSHLKDNVCISDEIKYKYLINWMAHAVRHPDEQGHVAIAIQGEKGVGKNVAAEGFERLWGQHGIIVSDQQRITGNFNSHLRDKCVLIADEAFFAGDKRHEGVLKSLITGNELTIEAKGVDAVKVPNLLHIIVLGNDRWLVPATFEERRFLFLRCARTKIQDKNYFRAIQLQLDHGGYEALLWHLLQEVDLTDFEVREAPFTEELMNQMVESLRDIEAAWFDCLYNGIIPGRIQNDGSVYLSAYEFIEWAGGKNGRQYHRLRPQHLGDLFSSPDHRLGESFDFGRVTKMIGDRRSRLWAIPPLSEARSVWDRVRRPYPWPNDGGAWDILAGDDYAF